MTYDRFGQLPVWQWRSSTGIKGQRCLDDKTRRCEESERERKAFLSELEQFRGETSSA